ncbi:MAG: chaperone modulator CbpM [Thermodesulfobacteriota bacterium]|nr:chaperone modulator CbpM [Thermodesulfobacteriota bacterium]
MSGQRAFMIRLRRTSRLEAYLDVYDVAAETGVHPEFIRRLVRLGLLDPVEAREGQRLLFEVSAVPLVRKILRLRRDLGLNYAGIGVVLELMERIESLEARIRELEGDFFE